MTMTVAAERYEFGHLDTGERVEAVTLESPSGITATVIALGASLQAFRTPDRNGVLNDIVLGYDAPQAYADHRQFFGATVGRFANRIAEGRFTLDGRTYQLDRNEGGRGHLHGGEKGFDRPLWSLVAVEQGPAAASVALAYVSPDGASGYPGRVEASVEYRLDADGSLWIDHRAVTDAPTIVNLTHHSYFNLSGHGAMRSALEHDLTIAADRFLPVDAAQIPTGEWRAVAGTVFDFRTPARVGARVRRTDDPQLRRGAGYDHNYAVNGAGPRGQETARTAAHLSDAASGRTLEILTTAPGIQFYSGNALNGIVPGKGGIAYRQGDGICLEPQGFPDAPNQESFPPAVLRPGEEYRNLVILRPGTCA